MRLVTVPELLRRRAEEDPDGVLIEHIGGRCLTNAAFHATTLRLADGLAAMRVGAGDRVGVLLDATPISHMSWLASAWLRALEVPINPEFRGTSLVHALHDSAASILITSNALLQRVEAVADRLSSPLRIVTIDDAAPNSPFDVTTLSEVIAAGVPTVRQAPRECDPHAVIYTSGTTGPSKGVVVPWGGLHAGTAQMFVDDDASRYPAGAVYSPWPNFHSSGKASLTYAAMNGLRLVMRDRFSVTSFWDDVRRHGCTHAHLLGFAPLLLDRPVADDDADNPLRCGLMMPLSPRFREFEQRFGVKVSTGWGMTEIGFPMATSDPPNSTTCGLLSSRYEARIVDDDDFEVPDGEVGQLIIRTSQPWVIMTEYFGRPEATARAWRNGWFHTGDALRKDADGFYYFVDRLADYVRSRGHNISSLEVEAEVRAHEQVEDCACIGVPSEIADLEGDADGRAAVTRDDDVKIVVIRVAGSTLTAAQLIGFLVARMPRFMVPRYVTFADSLPRTPTGKVRKSELRSAPTGHDWDRVAAGIEVPR